MGMNLVAFIWGLAEATIFFIVPDVILSIAGKDNLHRGLIACCYALAGALVGGMLMYGIGRFYASHMLTFLDWLPAISQSMITHVGNQFATDGWKAIFKGPWEGVPYKLYAVQAWAGQIPFGCLC